jgi:hypothetical protein
MNNYNIILFKNKKSKRIIKGFITEKKCFNKFNKLMSESDNVKFEVRYENAEECLFELAVVTNQDKYQLPLFKMDDLGRNEKVFIENNNDFVIKTIENYKIEEKIYDWQLDKRITFSEFLNLYFGNDNIKSVSTLHNKLVIQEDENFSLFSLKNIDDSNRLLETLESYMRNNGKNEAILVRDVSTTQRKWLYDVLVNNGFNRKNLYRQTTTFSKRS